MRRLSNQQRQALKKGCFLALSAAMFIFAMCAVPYLASAIPPLSGSAARNVIFGNSAQGQTIPVFALGNGETSDEEPSTEDFSEEAEPPVSQIPESSEPSEPEIQIPAPVPDDNDLWVSAQNLSWYEIGETPTLNIIDRTTYGVELSDYIAREFPLSGQITDDPLVLIIHTHGSESYLPKGYNFYDPEEDFRSTDSNETVVHIGDLLCRQLNSLGIPTIHDATMHDVPDYTESYNNSLDALEAWLAEYPTVKFVIDLHRDSVFDSNGNNVKPLTNINDEDCAQMMLVMGTNEYGIPHPDWRDNLTFAAYLQQKLNDMYPTLMRPVNLRKEEFNQAVTKGSIILEVGSCGNTVEEAENAIELFAQAYAALLKERLS